MDDLNNQPNSPSPAGGGDKVNPMSPSFMSGPAPAAPTPNNPPTGGMPGGAPTPPPPPPAPPVPTPPPSPSPTGGSPVPPPPPKQVDIRTMASDQSSLKASGGTGVMPQTVKPMGKAPRKIDSAGRPVGGDKKRALFIGLGIVVFLGAAAAVANYFVLPIFLSDTQLNEPPIVEETAPPIVTPTVPTFTHTSYFAEYVDMSTEVNISDTSLANINAALNQTAATRADGEEGLLTEFAMTQGIAGAPVTSDEFLTAMLPDVQFIVSLEPDFTGFMYDTGAEVRTGYIFALEGVAEADLESAQMSFNDSFESSQQLANLFLGNPGTPAEGGFKDGATLQNGVQTRWLAYSNEGTSIDYGWKGPFVVISTSFDGFKAVIDKVMEDLPASAEASTEDTTPDADATAPVADTEI